MYNFKRVTLEDAPLIYQWKNDPYIREMALDETYQNSVKKQEEDIHRAIKSTSSLYDIIYVKEMPIGYIRIDWMNDEQTYAWLRFALGVQRNKGHMYHALQAYISTLIKKGCFRIEAEVYEYNQDSIRLLKKLRFHHEGTKRKAHLYHESYHDIYVFGLLASDWNEEIIG